MSQTTNAAMGTRIRLISNSDIRYEGYLFGIDSEDNTVSLKNVRIFGTEGRKGGINEVPASDQLFEAIVFRGDDIKDLTLYEQSAGVGGTVDPAILSATPARPVTNANEAAVDPFAAPAGHPPGGSHKGFGTAVRGGGGNFYDDHGSHPSGGARGGGGFGNGGGVSSSGRYRRGGYGGGRGGGGGYGHYRRRHAEGHTGQDFHPAVGNRKEEFKEEFDFEKSREEFEKKKSEFEKVKEDLKGQVKGYSKSGGFFDNISSDRKDRNQIRTDREQMKKADAETFGTDMVGSMRGFRRGRDGRGRYHRY